MPQLLVTNSSPGTPKQLSSVAKNFRHATIIGCKSLNGPSAGPNAGLVRLGLSAAANEQPLEFNPGDERSISTASNQMLDLSQYYLDVANAGDGVVILYQ